MSSSALSVCWHDAYRFVAPICDLGLVCGNLIHRAKVKLIGLKRLARQPE